MLTLRQHRHEPRHEKRPVNHKRANVEDRVMRVKRMTATQFSVSGSPSRYLVRNGRRVGGGMWGHLSDYASEATPEAIARLQEQRLKLLAYHSSHSITQLSPGQILQVKRLVESFASQPDSVTEEPQ